MHAPKELQDKCLQYSFSFVNVILEVCLGFKKTIKYLQNVHFTN